MGVPGFPAAKTGKFSVSFRGLLGSAVTPATKPMMLCKFAIIAVTSVAISVSWFSIVSSPEISEDVQTG